MADVLNHFDEKGAARMVDVGSKPVTLRTAAVEGRVTMRPETLSRIQDHQVSKGDVLQVARVAGILAAKRTADIVPLCHPVPLEKVDVDFDVLDERTLRIRVRAQASAKTGVEMEALTAAMVAGLTIYDMCKAVDRSMALGPFVLVEKAGGKSGHFRRKES